MEKTKNRRIMVIKTIRKIMVKFGQDYEKRTMINGQLTIINEQ